MATDTDEHGEEKESKILEPETVFYEPESGGEPGFDSGLVVGGFPTSVELDPTTQVVEELKSEGVEAALVALYPEEGELVNPERGPVYNTPVEKISRELEQAVDDLAGDTAVFGYCAGGVYALESGIMDRRDTSGFIGSDIPQGMENYQKTLEPETDGLVFYDQQMNGRIDARNVDVYGTDHIWVDTPGNYGEAQVRAGDVVADDSEVVEIKKLVQPYEWLEKPDYTSRGEGIDATGA